MTYISTDLVRGMCQLLGENYGELPWFMGISIDEA